MLRPIETEFRLPVPFSCSEIWPILSKTDWINRAIGLPPVQYEIKPLPEGGSAVRAHARLFGIPMRWREIPFEWNEGEFYEVHRIFESGLLTDGRLGVEFQRDGECQTTVRVYSILTPRHSIGSVLAKSVLIPKTNRAMRHAVEHMGEHLKGRQRISLPNLPRQKPDEFSLREGLRKLRGEIRQSELVEKIEEELRSLPDVELSHIRPFAVARRWGCDRWEVLRLFLHATRCGLLDFSWEVLCPNCRSTRQPRATSLAQLGSASHCEVCQIKFDAEFDKSVELKFSVNSAVRPCDSQTFCLAGPGGKPHIVSQLLVGPGQDRDWIMPDLAQPLRMRSLQVSDSVIFRRGTLPSPGFRASVECHPDGFHIRSESAPEGTRSVRFSNPNAFTVRICLERQDWSDEILTAAQVTNWQEFRDLFDTEVISPTERVTVGSQIILFTDLRGSTAMYNGIGDAPAYTLVRDHFTVLDQAIRDYHGTIVKTIGDAVMAVFSRVDEGLNAVAQMHARLRDTVSSPKLDSRLMLKSSLHIGPCLAVNANDKLDYFGTTINLAARLVGSSKGDDLVLSSELFHRPETEAFLKASGLSAERLEEHFRGFNAPREIWRITMKCSESESTRAHPVSGSAGDSDI